LDRFDSGINTFDTANVYSNGLSEVILGKALQQFKIPREEVVILTKVNHPPPPEFRVPIAQGSLLQVFYTVGDVGTKGFVSDPDTKGYVNRHGLSRKVKFS